MKEKKKLSKRLYPVWFLLPFFTLVSIFYIIPCLLSIAITFTDFDIKYDPKFVGLKNYQRVLRDPNFGKIFRNSIIYVIGALAIIIFMSLLISILTQFYVKKKWLRYTSRTIWLAMNALPSIIYALVIKGVFSSADNGAANVLLMRMGVIDKPIAWFSYHPLALVIFTTGFLNGASGVIILSSAINAIPEDYFNSARVNGSSEFGIVTQIIIPMLRWPLMYISITNAIGLVSGYQYIMLLTDGGPNRKTTTLSLYSYQNAFSNIQYGYGSAIAMVVILISVVLVFAMFRLFNFDEMVQPPRIDD